MERPNESSKLLAMSAMLTAVVSMDGIQEQKRNARDHTHRHVKAGTKAQRCKSLKYRRKERKQKRKARKKNR